MHAAIIHDDWCRDVHGDWPVLPSCVAAINAPAGEADCLGEGVADASAPGDPRCRK